jgi:hypothetical protein
MILQRTSLNLRNIPTFHVTRMSSESMNVKQRKKDYEEGISLRAQRRVSVFTNSVFGYELIRIEPPIAD